MPAANPPAASACTGSPAAPRRASSPAEMRRRRTGKRKALAGSDLPRQQSLQQVPVTVRLVLGAMAKKRHIAGASERLQKPQREFLTMVLDGAVARVHATAFGALLAIAAGKLGPIGLAGQNIMQKLLARTEIGHPDVVAV